MSTHRGSTTRSMTTRAILSTASRLGWGHLTVLGCAALIGAGASLMLLITELHHLSNPDAALSCDINPLVGCGSSLMTWQAHLLGFPNSAIGLAAFSALATAAVLLATGSTVTRLAWRVIAIGAVGGLGMVAFFVTTSVTGLGALCPYCMVIWSMTMIIASIAIPQALTLDVDDAMRRLVMRYTWAYAVAAHLIVIIIVVVMKADVIATVLS